MGQSATKGGFEYRYVSEAECFKRKLLLVQPPETLLRRCLSDTCTRVLRSVSVQTVVWDSQTLLPEQWMSILGNQLFVAFFVSYRNKTLDDGEEMPVLPTAEEVEERFVYSMEKIEQASPDAKRVIVIWDNAQDGNDPWPEEAAEEVHQEDENKNDGNGDDGAGPAPADGTINDDEEGDAEQNDKDDDDDEEPVHVDPTEVYRLRNEETLRRITRLSKQYSCKVIRVTSSEERFALSCLMSTCVMPSELSRPLCSLLYQLRDMCLASEAYLIDSLTFHPLLSTLDVDPENLDHYLHQTLWVFRTCVRRIMRACDSDLHLMVLPCGGDTKVYVGWACRPYAYVMIIVRDTRTSDLLVEKNMEHAAMHFYNVINNTTTRRTYTPMTA